MVLTPTEIAEDPLRLTSRLKCHDGSDVMLRPLTHADTGQLAEFLGALSSESRRFSTFDGYDLATARELCDAIVRYDKLRLVLADVPSGRIVGLLEFSLALTPVDIARYRDVGIRLTETTDCRFGPTLADDYQGRGVGPLAFPLVAEVARLLGRTRIILWGGVRADNPRAVRYYEKNGFQPVGSFTEAAGERGCRAGRVYRPCVRRRKSAGSGLDGAGGDRSGTCLRELQGSGVRRGAAAEAVDERRCESPGGPEC